MVDTHQEADARDVIYARWHRKVKNWGDDLSPYIVELISGKPAVYTANPFRMKYLVIGSIMNRADRNTIVWGTGAMRATLPRFQMLPRKICAVRGPLTRELLVSRGAAVPEVYGDPALLISRFYNPSIPKRFEYGIVPHNIDRDSPWVSRIAERGDVAVIDVRSETHAFVERTKECRYILSSSLHGIICADSYGIPAMWIELSGGVAGDGFKFHDYFASIHRENTRRVRVTETMTVEDVMEHYIPYTPDIDLDALYAACPFRAR